MSTDKTTTSYFKCGQNANTVQKVMLYHNLFMQALCTHISINVSDGSNKL